ncbi:hypothetical protein [Sphingomonas sp. KC8]|uniref:hypothetical protein n=1 Tax=Sphingomonas sp. KC8 TaxID=1030157 RepID=UPI000248A434|nr:hypothetical protein [Sphingomonas sp. KC8]ARS27615.1 hypothetical protein KC8_09955 [Sphingomonas sp. KC8]
MPAARSQTNVVNLALVKLGSSTRILSLEEGSAVANAARTAWDTVLEATLASHPWNFAIRRKALGADAAAPAFGYARSFTLPPDCLRWLPQEEMRRISPIWPIDDDGVDYCGGGNTRREGNKLLSNRAAPLPIIYIGREDNPAMWSPGFVMTQSASLAVELCEAVTGSSEIDTKLERRLNGWIAEGKRLDGMETPPEDMGDIGGYSWLDALA